MILSFSDWSRLNEARDKEALIQDYREKMPNAAETVGNLEFLLNTGLIDDSGYEAEIKEIASTFKKWMKGHSLNPKEKEDLDILKAIAKESGSTALNALESDGAQALFDRGLHLVSSPTQLANGNLVFSLDPNYRVENGWGIGFFPGPRRIRRMTPKGINLGIWGRSIGSMDITIKIFPNVGSKADFFNTAMLWAAENIDFEHAELFPEETESKYRKKKKGVSRASRTKYDDLLVQANALENEATQRFTGEGERDVEEFYEKKIKATNLRLEAAGLKGDAQEIQNQKENLDYYIEKFNKWKNNPDA